MNYKSKSIRTFIGAKNYQESRNFYKELGFEEIELFHNMCFFKVNENLGFYLQDAYVKQWINNSMVFLEVDDIVKCQKDLMARGLHDKYKHVGELWHFGQFNTKEWLQKNFGFGKNG